MGETGVRNVGCSGGANRPRFAIFMTSVALAAGCNGSSPDMPGGGRDHGGANSYGHSTMAGQGGAGGAAIAGSTNAGGAVDKAGTSATGVPPEAGGTSATGGATEAGGTSATGGAIETAGAAGLGGATSSGGSGAGSSSNTAGAASNDKYVVAMLQSSKSQAKDLTYEDIKQLVESAIVQAGGLGFVKDGQTVVLKPNLVTAYSDPNAMTPAKPTTNGITTDWRIVKAVAEVVRASNPNGKILVMEGSSLPTRKAYSMLGYTVANFGSSVDEFIALEGTSCTDVSTIALEQRTAASGKKYWINSRYVNADVVISLPTMKTHYDAGITGAVKNLGLGTTPVGQFPSGTNSADSCGRGQTASVIDHSGPEPLGAFIRDYYSLRPADFVVVDALQGLEHGPLPAWDSTGSYDYVASQKNMRLILAGRNAVAVDTIQALVMKCDPKRVPHLTKLEADGLGTTDTSRITVVGKQVSEVAKAFAGALTDICPGK